MLKAAPRNTGGTLEFSPLNNGMNIVKIVKCIDKTFDDRFNNNRRNYYQFDFCLVSLADETKSAFQTIRIKNPFTPQGEFNPGDYDVTGFVKILDSLGLYSVGFSTEGKFYKEENNELVEIRTDEVAAAITTAAATLGGRNQWLVYAYQSLGANGITYSNLWFDMWFHNGTPQLLKKFKEHIQQKKDKGQLKEYVPRPVAAPVAASPRPNQTPQPYPQAQAQPQPYPQAQPQPQQSQGQGYAGTPPANPNWDKAPF